MFIIDMHFREQEMLQQDQQTTRFWREGNRRQSGMKFWSSPGIKVPVMLKCSGRETHSAEWCRPLLIDGYRKQWSTTRWALMKGEKGLKRTRPQNFFYSLLHPWNDLNVLSVSFSAGFVSCWSLRSKSFLGRLRQTRRLCWRGRLRCAKEPKLCVRKGRARDRNLLPINLTSSSCKT